MVKGCVEKSTTVKGVAFPGNIPMIVMFIESLLSTVYWEMTPLGLEGGMTTIMTGSPLLPPDTNGALTPSGTRVSSTHLIEHHFNIQFHVVYSNHVLREQWPFNLLLLYSESK